MARTSLASIISHVRGMIDDPAGASQVFTDDDIQDTLDRRAEEARYVHLTGKFTVFPNATHRTQYLTFYAPVGTWEDGVELVDASWNPLTPATSNLWIGKWTFTEQPRFPVQISGFTHDIYGAAGDLLNMRATKESGSFDVNADGVSLSRSQKAQMYRDRALDYLARARTISGNLVRTDERC